MVMMTPVTI